MSLTPFPQTEDPGFLWFEWFKDLRRIVNLLDTSSSSSSSTGTWKIGDFVKNSNPSELGIAGSKYIIHGWICTASGSPGTWFESRTLTGN